ncbi:hypothetical protein Hypma_013119 [Hypsizygus marmoreus]|uniref:Uncharacterized protein n=1 Tax=Hypsizygus marmoreus TaxID=39966 RepID=A0A369JMY9_HYPMA|nr:hypothetical protein Hypma_013119 [Hypsizygus marmoreus]
MSKEQSTSNAKLLGNNNPRGKNQHKDCPPSDDPRVPELLRAYQRKGIFDRKRISSLLRSEHGIKMSESTVARRRRELGLRGSGRTTQELPDSVKRQLVLDQLAKDPTGKIGAATVKTRIFRDTGIDLTREWIRNEMRILAPEAYEARRCCPRATARTSTNRTARVNPESSSSLITHCGSTGDLDADIDMNHDSPSRVSRAPSVSFSLNSTIWDDHSDVHERLALSTMEQSHNVETPTRSSLPQSHSELVPDNQPTCADSPAPSLPTLMDMLKDATPRMTDLTQSLRTMEHSTEPLKQAAYDGVLKCMEAAAMLERQLARVASRSAPHLLEGDVRTRR